jgi:hypothetical protein
MRNYRKGNDCITWVRYKHRYYRIIANFENSRESGRFEVIIDRSPGLHVFPYYSISELSLESTKRRICNIFASILAVELTL